jgi:transcription elongation factor Elf1
VSKEFTVSATCPACGHRTEAIHTEDAMREAFGNDATIHVLCAHCQASFDMPMGLACAEWDDYCNEISLPADV